MRKAVVRHGDPTTTGGFVIAFSSTIHDKGRKAALSGDQATCGNCEGIFKLFGTGDGMAEEGRNVVVDGDLVLCPCGKNRAIIGNDPGIFLEVAGDSAAGGAAIGVGRPLDDSNGATDTGGEMQFDNARPFTYRTGPPATNDAFQLAGSEGTPRNNQAQNRQFKAVIRALGLNHDQAQELHQEISRQGLGYHEIMQRAVDMFGAGDD